MRQLSKMLDETKAFGHFLSPPRSFCPFPTVHFHQREDDILPRIHMGEKIEGLEEESVLLPKGKKPFLRYRQLLSINPDTTTRRRLQSANKAKESRFPPTGRTNQGEDAQLVGQGKVDPIDRSSRSIHASELDGLNAHRQNVSRGDDSRAKWER